MPFVDSVIRGLLMATDHPYRAALAGEAIEPPPRAIRAAIDRIEMEPHRPWTVSSLAARSHVSVRSLQLGFRTHVGTTPMEYLREVRMRRARRDLQHFDPSSHTVSSIASRWGFSNAGRFSAAYTDRFGETPTVTLRRPTTRAARQPSRPLTGPAAGD
jgi:transcriptional regulator GlxA family with amidase domain